MPLKKKVEDFCLEYAMLPRGSAVIAAVSGGADSMCLLDILRCMAEERQIALYACHFDHRLRGDESAGDAAFVAEYCRGLGIECFMGSGDVAAYAKAEGCGIEEAARILRYRFFEECSQKLGGALVATAHNADDNAETVLMHLMRGAGSRGMGGIPPRRDIYIRPLLAADRAEIEAYLVQKGIPHREDSSNAVDDVLRNRIRHQVTPAIKALCPNWGGSVLSAAALARQDDDCLESMAREFINTHGKEGGLSAAALTRLHPAVSSRVVRAMAGTELSRRHVEAVLKLAAGTDPSAAADLPGVQVRREYDRLVFGKAGEMGDFPETALPLGVKTPINVAGKSFLLTEQPAADPIYNSFTTYLFKKDKVCGMICVRPRRSGDTLKLKGRGTKTLKKLFIEEKIPAVMRGSIPVIADDEGVLAVVGLGADVRAMAAAGDEAYRLEWEDIGL